MWYIQEEPANPSTAAPAVSYWFGGVDGHGRTIGRKNVDIRLKASSVSRTHATIHVQSSSFHRASRGTVPTVTDSSAYGTFLKYPRGHHAHWGAPSDGHHDRLDKDTPVELSEGALLAFGAPSSWWRVGWYSILVFPYALPPAESARLAHVVKVAGLAVVDPTEPWSNDITHLLTPVCRASSGTFLRSLVGGKQIVSPAWANAVLAMVDACKGGAQAPSEGAAAAATAIPPEEKYRPPFADEDVASFDADMLAHAFDSDKQRASLFSSVTFVFPDDGARVQWTNVLDACGARTVINPAASREFEKLVYVRPVVTGQTGAAGASAEPVSDDGPSCCERDIISAILAANGDVVLSASRGAPMPLAPAPTVPDASTPVPSDSDAETADNDPVDVDSVNALRINRRKRPRICASVESAEDDREAKAEFVVPPCVDVESTKAVRLPVEDEKRTVVSNAETDNIADRSEGPQPFENKRAFFKLGANSDVYGVVKGGATSSTDDVRRFKRNPVLQAPPIPLEKASYREADDTGRIVAGAVLGRQLNMKKPSKRGGPVDDQLDNEERADVAVIDDEEEEDVHKGRPNSRRGGRGRAMGAFVDD